jgi:hypothetical protein
VLVTAQPKALPTLVHQYFEAAPQQFRTIAILSPTQLPELKVHTQIVHHFPVYSKLFKPENNGKPHTSTRPYAVYIDKRQPPEVLSNPAPLHEVTIIEEPTPFKINKLTFTTRGFINDHETEVLLDSGAGMTGLINRNHGLHCGLIEYEKPDDKVTVVFGNHTTSESSTFMDIPLRLGNAKFTVTALVVPDLGPKLILGDPWMNHHKAILDFQTKSIRLSKPNGHRISLYMHDTTTQADTHPNISVCLTATAIQKVYRRKQVAEAWIVLIKPQTDEPSIEDALPPRPIEEEPPLSPPLTFAQKVEKQIPGNTAPDLRMKALLLDHEDTFPEQLRPNAPIERQDVQTACDLEPGKYPPNRAMFRYSPKEREEMERAVKDMLEKGLIEPSASPFGAPVLFIKKPDGSLRFCIDYRGLNKITIKNRYPLPRIDDLLDRLQGATTFSSLDLLSGYYQLRLPLSDIPKTAFRTPFGLYQWKVLPMGLTNAPSVFMAAMNRVLADLKFAIVYLDDILIFSKSPEEHVGHMREVLKRLKDNQYFCKLTKCDFFKTSIKFLGHIVSPQGVSPDPAKVASILNWPTPQNVSDVRSFLGLANYFRKFIENYAEITTPLTNLVKGGVSKRKGKITSVTWDDACTQAFEKLKSALANAPCLALPNFTKPFQVITDASDFAIGAILVQEGRPIAFESKKLNPAERNYHTTDRELLAVVHALTIWRCYLEGPPFTVLTDHNPLTHINDQATLSRRQARWSEYLQGFQIKWEYRPGVGNPADPLSRLSTHLQEAALTTVTARPNKRQKPNPQVDLSDVERQCKENYAKDPWFRNPKHTESLELIDGLYYKTSRLCVPSNATLRTFLIDMAHTPPLAGHGGVNRTLRLLTRHFWWPKIIRDVTKFVCECPSCQAVKARRTKPNGLLQPLPIPHQKWWTVTMDFVVELPPTPNGNNAILVFVDKLTKMIHLAPTTTNCNAQEAANLFVQNIIRLHGVPRMLISDRDTRFRATFYREVMARLNIQHGFSTAYHPQTDGQTENVNAVVEDYLRHYVNTHQNNWESMLPMAEFAYNNAYHTATQTTPFLLNYGVEPLTPLTFLTSHQLERRNNKEDGLMAQCPAAKRFTERMQDALTIARRCLEAAQQRDKANADKKRKDITHKVGDYVLLSTKNLRLKKSGSRKLLPRYIGPFPITKVVNRVTYELHLPAMLKCHNVFHVSLLQPYVQGRSPTPLPIPEVIDDLPEWEVQTILEHKTTGTKHRKRTWFLIRWKDFDATYDTWEPESNLTNCQDLLQAYKLQNMEGCT